MNLASSTTSAKKPALRQASLTLGPPPHLPSFFLAMGFPHLVLAWVRNPIILFGERQF